ncbi:hypothetical protein SVEN_7451 [Streptomyces venezuelae ATCC 10712]|uniref:Uncharacterized protein n=1 Tax=Streptomyces venezuelae (strain ATCC 10712 / CBS 650.69 / DSM 40230 / JCM 4526 / NBRC 13096 / PD 04745) TaxID=953739 RepID=F2R338_STRVP|nr:hypothetical protein SVEN_7451 [Streptomyces venezuelae ATCC 10712]
MSPPRPADICRGLTRRPAVRAVGGPARVHGQCCPVARFDRLSLGCRYRSDARGAGPPPAERHSRGRTARAASCSGGRRSDESVPMPPDRRPCCSDRSSATVPTSLTVSPLRRG